MLKNIYYFANFGNLKGLPTGGGTTSSRRLRATLEKFGYNVDITNRHRPEDRSTFKGKFSKYFWICIDPILFFNKLLFKKRKESTVLFRTYTGSLLPFDFLITLAATLTGHNKIMCLAGGKAYGSYYQGSAFYKWLFRQTVRQYDEILTEGEINLKLIEEASKGKVRAYYLPNFTEEGFAPEQYPAKSADSVNIMFFGRLTPEKNILLIIDVFEGLQKKYGNIHLLLVGSGPKEYENKVKEKIDSSTWHSNIEWKPWADHGTIKEMMSEQHICLFPSAEPCEGHSNALNEAMSWGLVPIVSSNNYLPAIAGYPELVAHSFDKDEYIRIISTLIDSNRLEEFGKKAFERVRDNFTQSVVELRLKDELLKYTEIIK